MAKSLAEYAAQHPQPMPEPAAATTTGETIRERLEALEKAEQLKASILRQIDSGNAPQIILYTALKCIGLLSNDPDFAEAGEKILDKIYADLAQLSFTADNAAIEAQRLKELQEAYNAKLREVIKRQIKGNDRINRALYAALEAVDSMEPQPLQEP